MSPNSPYRRRRPAPEPSAASRRRRKRRERDRRRRGRRTVLLAVFVAVPAVVLAVAAVGGNGRVRLVLQPQRAASGCGRGELVRLRLRRVAARRDSGGAQPHAGLEQRDQPVDGKGDGRDRGPALLPARRHRPARDHARGRRRRQSAQVRPGRLDDHTGARAQPLPDARAHVEAQAGRSLSRDQARRPLVEEADPHRVHERGVLRQSRVRDRCGGRDVLLHPGSQPDPRPVRAARRAAPGAVDLRPVPRPRGCSGAAQRRVARAARQRRHHLVGVRAGEERPRSASEAGPSLLDDPRAVLLRLRRGSAAAGVRLEHRS